LKNSNIIRISIKPDLNNINLNVFKNIDQSTFKALNEINLNLVQFNYNILDKLRVNTNFLEEICYVKDGIVPFIREKLISTKKIDERYVKFSGISGKYKLNKYYFSTDEMYLCYDINEAKKYIKDQKELRKVQLRDKNIFLSRKIITSQNSNIIKGTIDNDNYFVSNYILALINSKLLNYFHNSLRLKGTDLHPQILLSNLKKIPIKIISLEAQKPFIFLVGQILKITSTSDYEPKNPPVRQKELENQIDELVYKLYGLTEEEIEIVENSSKK
jgi:hypothetical protein